MARFGLVLLFLFLILGLVGVGLWGFFGAVLPGADLLNSVIESSQSFVQSS